MDGRSTTRISIQIPKPDSRLSVQHQGEDHTPAALLPIEPPNQIVCSLAAATAHSSSSPSPRFQLPEGWIIEERPRRTILPGGTLADKYYIEPGTGGKRFRSLSAVKRYLTQGEECVANRRAIKQRYEQNNMQIVPSISDGSSQLGLPCGWLVESRPRRDASRFDKYYIEPGTGRRFRSLPSVQRHITGGKEAAKPKMIKPRSDQDNMQIVPIVTDISSEMGLPYGWLVELRRRRDGSKYDRYYIEPGTGRKFRSLVSAQRHITQDDDLTATLKAIISVDDYSTGNTFTGKLKIKRLADVGNNDALPMPQHSDTKPLVDVKETGALRRPGLPTSPTRVKWVFDGQGENTWRPSIDDSLVPNSEIHEWSEAFVMSMDSQ
ncbi:unnamed protein product [Linum trigynum]|uniref:MBD domain-containing protein n=1 Tax=Linum trigynum TaxID=586398 RepID=A0AAV2FQG8_9ROSI